MAIFFSRLVFRIKEAIGIKSHRWPSTPVSVSSRHSWSIDLPLGGRRTHAALPEDADQSPLISIIVVLLNGTRITLPNFYPSDTILSVKAKIWDRSGLLVNDVQHQLILATGRRLRDAKTLDMYSIRNGATIYLVWRNPKMLVYVATLTGKTLSIFTGASEPIGYIKLKIQKQEGIPPDQQRLVFAGKHTENKRTVSDFGIRKGCKLHLVLRLRAGSGLEGVAVNLPSGHAIDVRVDEDVDTIYQLKLQIQNSEGIPVDRQMIMCDQREVMDFVRISDCEYWYFDLLLRDVQIRLPSTATENPQRLWEPSILEREISYRDDDETQTQRNRSPKSQRNSAVPVPLPIVERDIVVLPAPNLSIGAQRSNIPRKPVVQVLAVESLNPQSSSSRRSATTSRISCTSRGCTKTFSSQEKYTRHIRYHTRPENCLQCARRFGTKTHLNRHINDVHTTTITFFCPVGGCKYSSLSGIGKFFTRKDHLKRHMQQRHAGWGAI